MLQHGVTNVTSAFTKSWLDRVTSRKRKLKGKEERVKLKQNIFNEENLVCNCLHILFKVWETEETLHDVTTKKLDMNLRTMALEIYLWISKLSGKTYHIISV